MLFSIFLFSHVVLASLIGLRVLFRKLDVGVTLAWFLILFMAPLAGIIFYFLFGEYTLGRRREKDGERIRGIYQKAYNITDYGMHRAEDLEEPWDSVSNGVYKDTGFPVMTAQSWKVLSEADDIINAMCVDIDAAQDTCYMEFYIIDPVGRVELIFEAMERASKRGVQCKILADNFGSRAFLFSKWPERLREAGISVAPSLSVSILKSFSNRSDLRNHRKILICDQIVGYMGSFNLVDPKYFKADANVGEWIDVMIRMRGTIVDALGCVFNTDYLFDTTGVEMKASDIRNLPLTPGSHGLRIDPEDALMQMVPSGPEMPNSTIYELLVSTIFKARKSVTIVTPYFIPDQAILLALKSAAKRGLDVQVIVPTKIDSKMARYASESGFDELLEAGVVIQQYDNALLHSKMVLIDGEIGLFGTVNLDMRSFYLNLELTIVIYDDALLKTLYQLSEQYLSNCTRLELDVWSKRGGFQRLLENVMRLVSPLL